MKPNLFKNEWGFYTKPTLVTRKNDLSKKWFVQFYFAEHGEGNPRDLPPIQRAGGMNYASTVAERTRQGNELRKDFADDLSNNWHPRKDCYPDQIGRKLQPFEEWREKTIERALADAYEGMKLKPTSKKDYRIAIDHFTEALHALDLQDTKMSEVRRSTVMTIMDAYKLIRSASDKRYNQVLQYIKSIFTRASKYCELEHSPATGIDSLKVNPAKPFKAPTNDEKALIRQTLEMHYPNFFRMVMVVYHTGIRPSEVLSLQIRDLDRVDRRFNIIPEDSRDNSKTNTVREVPINAHLWKLLEQMNLHEYPGNYYIFGGPGKKNSRKYGSQYTDSHYFPSEIPINGNMAGKLWKKLIKEPVKNGGLGLTCDMYGLKHKGAEDKKRAGISIDAMQKMYGHSKREMTERYLPENYHEDEIRKFSPDF